MSKKLVRVTTAVFLAVLVAACSSQKGGSGASSSDTGGGTAVGDGSATSVGVGPDGGLSPEEMAARGRGGLQTVFYFEYDQSALSPETRAELDAQANVLRGQTGVVRLEGHTDDRGSREYNLALGERRAAAIANYLVLQGIDRSRIETVSYGEERPAALGEDEASWSRNRRVELR
jgi:peptidoglycan-associated lipoprotein